MEPTLTRLAALRALTRAARAALSTAPGTNHSGIWFSDTKEVSQSACQSQPTAETRTVSFLPDTNHVAVCGLVSPTFEPGRAAPDADALPTPSATAAICTPNASAATEEAAGADRVYLLQWL